MKIIHELSLKVNDHLRSQFKWFNNDENWLFVVEDNKVLRILKVDDQNNHGQDLHSATLTDSRLCTSFSWNQTASKLALIVDKKLIYLWDIKVNNFTHFKPKNRILTNNSQLMAKTNKSKELDLIVWSKVSNKFLFSYASGQIVICDCDKNFDENFIDNSFGVLGQVVFVECCETIDMFACITIISEVLVMTFSGESKFYIQSEDLNISRLKFSCSNYIPRESQYVWFSYQTDSGRIFFKMIRAHQDKIITETHVKANITYKKNDIDSKLVDHHWLNGDHLLICHASGLVELIKIVAIDNDNATPPPPSFELSGEKMLDILEDSQISADLNFKSFRLIGNVAEKSFSLAAITDYNLFYYELQQTKCYDDDDDNDNDQDEGFVYEKIDDLDLSGNLKKINLILENVEWSADGSMLALQLTNAHILIYRGKINNSLLVSHSSKIAYLSDTNEITVLNFKPDKTRTSEDASTISVDMKPSLMAISSNRLALALNNRVKFYRLSDGQLIVELEYVSIVTGLSLNSRFVAIHFNDGRIKLHSIGNVDDDDADDVDEERFFPDPNVPEKIACFKLTQNSFLYSTEGLNLRVFCLNNWSIIQSYNHSTDFNRPITKLYPNEVGTKCVCLFEPLRHHSSSSSSSSSLKPNSSLRKEENHANVYLYDIHLNLMLEIKETTTTTTTKVNNIYSRIVESQLKLVNPNHDYLEKGCIKLSSIRAPRIESDISNERRFDEISNAIWDSDGRSLLLVERKFFHIIVVLDNTLNTDDGVGDGDDADADLATFKFVCSMKKGLNYVALNVSHGIVSFQTSLGRIINIISSSHNDELKLLELEEKIRMVKENEQLLDTNKLIEIVQLKLIYLETILPIYSLTKCKDICDYLMSDQQFNLDRQLVETNSLARELDCLIWKHLAAWSLFTKNLNFALLIYRKHKLTSSACVLKDIIDDAQMNRNLDSKSSIKNRLLILLNCHKFRID